MNAVRRYREDKIRSPHVGRWLKRAALRYLPARAKFRRRRNELLEEFEPCSDPSLRVAHLVPIPSVSVAGVIETAIPTLIRVDLLATPLAHFVGGLRRN